MNEMDELRERFSLPGDLAFQNGPGGLVVAVVNNRHCQGRLALLGAHVLDYQPAGQKPVLWLSRQSNYQVGKPIRGGIPVCWPWFAPHPISPALPIHGLVRSELWNFAGCESTAQGETNLRLGLTDTESSRATWPHPFAIGLEVRFGAQLQVSLTAENPGPQPFSFSAALHSYFHISDILGIRIEGLDGRSYFDKVDRFQCKLQQGPVLFQGETDRVYLDATEDCLVVDPLLQRRLRIAKQGSRTTVIWNPGARKAALMPDFGDDEFPSMVCVETANAANDSIVLAAGEKHTLGTIISVEPLGEGGR